MRLAGLAVTSIVALLSTGAIADGAGGTPGSPASSPLLWATIDVCASTPQSDVVGVRASMPGTGKSDERMFMRFRLQYRFAPKNWRGVGRWTSFVDAGSARYLDRQAGRDFNLAASTAPGTVLRGVVAFEWRVGKTVVDKARRSTTAGRVASAGASPPGFSAARCTIS